VNKKSSATASAAATARRLTPAPRLVLTLALCLALALVLGSCSEGGWREFSSEDGGFSILLPVQPEAQTETVATGAGEIDLNLFIAETEEKTAYFVSYADYPRSAVSEADPYAILAGARDATLKAQNGRPRSDYRLRLGGHPGIEFTADVEVGGREAVLWARNYLVGSRLYQTFAMAYRGREPYEEMERFFHSFRVMER